MSAILLLGTSEEDREALSDASARGSEAYRDKVLELQEKGVTVVTYTNDHDPQQTEPLCQRSGAQVRWRPIPGAWTPPCDSESYTENAHSHEENHTRPHKSEHGVVVTKAYPYQDIQWHEWDDPQIRILDVQSAASIDVEIECELFAQYNKQEYQYPYAALSYTWGDQRDLCTIKLNGFPFQITRSLDSALRHLRRHDDVVRLWVDAICINQADLVEKSKMVAAMGLVYNNAVQTTIWLGDAGGDSDLAIDILEEVSNDGSESAYLKEMLLATSTAAIISDAHFLAEIREAHWTALSNFFTRPWWSRIWIVQEVTFSRSCDVFCGKRRTTWNTLRKALEPIEDAWNEALPYLPNDLAWGIGRMETIAVISSLQSRFSDAEAHTSMPSMKEAFCSFREWQSSDPRDKIYGTLSLARDIPGDMQVDYRKSALQVFTEAAKAIMVADDNLTLLSECEDCLVGDETAADLTKMDLRPRGHPMNLPSWVPNWTWPKITSSLVGDHRFDKASSESSKPYTAAHLPEHGIPTTPCFANPSANLGEQLFACAYTMDEVEAVGADWFDKKPDVKVCMREAHAVIVASCMEKVRLRYGETWGQALISTFVCDRISEDPDFFADDKDSFSDQRTWKAMRRAIVGRRFFVTKEGYIGLGPRSTRPGYLVCLVVGCHVPMLLEKYASEETLAEGIAKGFESLQSGTAGAMDAETKARMESAMTAAWRWHLVKGAAYVQGLMNGEGLLAKAREGVKPDFIILV